MTNYSERPVGSIWSSVFTNEVALWGDKRATEAITFWFLKGTTFTVLKNYNWAARVLTSNGVTGYVKCEHFYSEQYIKRVI